MIQILSFLCLMFLSMHSVEAEEIVENTEHTEILPKESFGESYLTHQRLILKELSELQGNERIEVLQEYEVTEADLEAKKAFLNHDWKVEGKYHLPKSNSTLSVPEGYILLTGEDAINFANSKSSSDTESVEAIVYDIETTDLILFENFQEGYVCMDDWKEIKPKELLSRIQKHAALANAKRKQLGIQEVQITEWLIKPTINRKKNTMRWALHLTEGAQGGYVEAQAIKLGKNGYEKVTLFTTTEVFRPDVGNLSVLLEAFEFDSGYRYGDFVSGDKVAHYEIATLTALKAGDMDADLGKRFLKYWRNFINTISTLTGDERVAELREAGITEVDLDLLTREMSLDWQVKGTYKLDKSNSTIILPDEYIILCGKEAIKGAEYHGNVKSENFEALVCDTSSSRNLVFFESVRDGYVSIEDWNDLDPDNFLSEIKKGNQVANLERQKRGLPEIQSKGWILIPTLSKITKTLYWATEVTDSNGNEFVNSVAMRLGREGYEKLTWIGEKSSYVPFGGDLEVMLEAFSFNPGYAYEDFKPGDKVADYDVSDLAAGINVVKSIFFIVFLKKFAAPIVAIVTAIAYKFKAFFQKVKRYT